MPVMSFRRVVFGLILLMLLSSQTLFAKEKGDYPQVKTKISKVAVFKDGYGFFIREGQTSLDKGWAEFNVMPNAVLGTVWVYSERADEPVEMLVRGEKTWELNPNMKALSLRAKVATSRSSVKLGLAYLEQGISWQPSYTLSLLDDNTAMMSLNALVTNDAEDLEDVRLNLVNDTAHFEGKDTPNPIGPQASLATTREFPEMGRAMMNPGTPAAMAMEPIMPSPRSLPIADAEELHLYKKDGVTLEKGQRAQIVLMSGKVNYEDIFEWDANSTDEVWHAIKLKNNLSAPWTSGLVMTVKNGQPISQQMLKYTAIGGDNNLRISLAPAVKVKQKEMEVSREEPKEIGKIFWVPVKMKGELKIENLRDEAIKIEIKKKVNGKVTTAPEDTEMTITPKPSEGLNSVSDLKIKATVEAGETKLVNYEYEVYVRI